MYKKIAKITISLLLLLSFAIPAWGINYPTHQPRYSYGGYPEFSVSHANGQFHSTGMRSTSAYAEQNFGNSGDAIFSPIDEDYGIARGPQRAPGGIGAVFARFLANFSYEEKEIDGETYKVYSYSEALAAWGSSNMPVGATWATFCDWFSAQGNLRWDIDFAPIGTNIWCLLLMALLYVGYIRYRKMSSRTTENKPLSILFLMFLLPQLLHAQTQDPTTEACEKAIHIQNGFEMQITEPGYYFFTATTYDLPLAIRYIPSDNRYQRSPLGWGDFSCNPGVYDDPNLIALVSDVNKWGYSMPLEFSFAMLPIESEFPIYQMDVRTEYRDQLALYGINYELQAWIMVEFFGKGTLTTFIDSTYRGCQQSSIRFQELDTIALLPATASDDVYLFPGAELLNDSVLFRWTGKQPLEIWIANTCEFPFDSTDLSVMGKFTINPSTGVDSLYLSPADIYAFLCLPNQTSVNYIRFRATDAGNFCYTLNPAPAPKEGAIALRMNQTVSLPAGVSPLYCFPVSWFSNNDPMIWRTHSTNADISLHLNIDAQFISTLDTTTAQNTYAFGRENGLRALPWSNYETEALRFANNDTYYYVRFVASEPVELTPQYWTDQSASAECITRSKSLSSQDKKRISANNSGQAYRIDVNQWSERNQDVLFNWEGRNNLTVWIMSSCKGNLKTTSENYINAFVLKYAEGSNRHVFTNAEIQAWKPYADEDGYIYMRFNVSSEGYVSCVPQNRQPIPTGIEINNATDDAIRSARATRVLRNGHVFILRNGHTYTIDGRMLGN